MELTRSRLNSSFRAVLDMIVRSPFHSAYVHLPDPDAPTPPEIATNPRRMPFFKDCIGALDGTQCTMFVEEGDDRKYRNHKGFLLQNVLAVAHLGQRERRARAAGRSRGQFQDPEEIGRASCRERVS